jgi:hypothetical protein
MALPFSLLDHIPGLKGDKKSASTCAALHARKRGHRADQIGALRSDLHPKECPQGI